MRLSSSAVQDRLVAVLPAADGQRLLPNTGNSQVDDFKQFDAGDGHDAGSRV
jgi:hypothetical protein